MKILVTAFEPYGMRTKNISQEVLTRLGRASSSHEIVMLLLPVDTTKAPLTLINTLRKGNFQAVVCLGEASSIRWVQLERLAVNWLDFPIPDNAGMQIVDQKVASDGPAAYFSSLPIRKCESVLQDQRIPVKVSMSAGTYLCNQVFYTLMHYLHEEKDNIPAGFIHLPVYSWDQQAGTDDAACGNREYEQIAGAVEDIIRVLVEI